MDFAEFDAHLARARAQHPTGDFDRWRATPADLARVERELGVRLPPQYRHFLQVHGAGQFLFVELLPAGDAHRWAETLLQANPPPVTFVAIAPVGTGDYWGFVVRPDRLCDHAVTLRYHEDHALEPAFDDFLDFITTEALRLTP